MATYPTAVITTAALVTPQPGQPTNNPSHSGAHTLVNGEIIAIETELGTTPKGSYATVAAALTTHGTQIAALITQIGTAALTTDGTLSANSDALIPSEKAVKTYVTAHTPTASLSTDGTMVANSDALFPSQKATVTYVTAAVSAVVVRGTFANAALSAGVLTITHNKALSSPYQVSVTIVNNTPVQVFPDQINTYAANSVKVDLTSYGSITGSWAYVVI